MPRESERLVGVRAKIERAEQHVRDLAGAVDAFRGSGRYEVASKLDPQAGQKVYYMARVDDVPPYIGSIAGDALHNLRSALDHLAMQLFIVGGGAGNERDISYPIIDTADPAKYEAVRAGKVQGMRQDAVDLIDATEPYQRGEGHQLWVLHKLDNIDKHRRLNIIGTHFGGFWTNPNMLRSMKARAKADPSIIGKSPPGYWFRPDDRHDTLKVGDELFRCPPHINVEDQTEFTFDVAINEPGVFQGEPAVELLHQLTHLVNGIADQFRPLL